MGKRPSSLLRHFTKEGIWNAKRMKRWLLLVTEKHKLKQEWDIISSLVKHKMTTPNIRKDMNGTM